MGELSNGCLHPSSARDAAHDFILAVLPASLSRLRCQSTGRRSADLADLDLAAPVKVDAHNPNPMHAIRIEYALVADDRNLFDERLGVEHALEGIAVMTIYSDVNRVAPPAPHTIEGIDVLDGLASTPGASGNGSATTGQCTVEA